MGLDSKAMDIDDAPDRKDLAEMLYEAYCQAVGGVAYDGKPLPKWAEFVLDPAKQKQAQGWLKVADCALDSLCE